MRSAIGHFITGRFLQAVFRILFMLVLVRVLDKGAFGVYMLLWGLVEFLDPLLSFGLVETSQKYIPVYISERRFGAVRELVRKLLIARNIINLGVLISLLAGHRYLFEVLNIESGYSDTDLGLWLILSVLGFRYSCTILETLLEQKVSQAIYASVQLGKLLGVCGIYIMQREMSLAWVLWVDLAVTYLAFAWSIVALRSRVRGLDSGVDTDENDAIDSSEIIGYAKNMLATNVMVAMGGVGAQRLAVGSVLGVDAAGAYAFMQQLIQIVNRYVPGRLFENIIKPMISSMVDGKQIVSRVMSFVMKLNMGVVGLVYAVVASASESIVDTLSGGSYEGYGDVFTILVLWIAVLVLAQPVRLVMQLKGLHRALLRISILYLLHVPSIVVLGKIAGLEGATAGLVLAQTVIAMLMVAITRRAGFGFEGVFRFTLIGGMAVLVSLLSTSWVDEPGARMLLSGMLFVVIFIALKPLSRDDLEIVSKGFGRRSRFIRPLVKAG